MWPGSPSTSTTAPSSTNVNTTTKTNSQKSSDFKQELNSLSSEKTDNTEESQKNESTQKVEEKNDTKAESKTEEKTSTTDEEKNEEDIDDALDGLQNVVNEVNQAKKDNPVSQKEEMIQDKLKDEFLSSDKLNKREDNVVINNDINIQEPKEQIMPQMDSGMNFNSDGRPFSAFVQQNEQKLSMSEKDLKEESEILSSMAENIAMVNRNNLAQQANNEDRKVKTVSNSDGIKKVDAKTNITVDTIAKFDSVIMDKSDVDFFAKLVENGNVDMNSVKGAEKSSQVSKTLADLLAKSMQDNKPVRIDFDNNISVIIRISKDGKISADFLPSSQVAEAYLKENLPLLRQKFDDNNINYDELNQRRQKQDERNNRKKGRDDE